VSLQVGAGGRVQADGRIFFRWFKFNLVLKNKIQIVPILLMQNALKLLMNVLCFSREVLYFLDQKELVLEFQMVNTAKSKLTGK
jgi:hypothetical protein